MDIFWDASGDDGAGANDVVSYEIERRPVGGSFASVGTVLAGVTSAVDTSVSVGRRRRAIRLLQQFTDTR